MPDILVHIDPPFSTASGSPEQRWELVSPYRARLVARAYSLLGNLHDAEDCASEAMLRAVNFPSLDEARVGQFLFTVTRRLCADVHRMRAREARAAQRACGPDTHEPAEDVCDEAEASWVMSLVASLPTRESSALLALAAGSGPREAAADLGVSAKAFESAVGRGRRRLKMVWRSTLGVAVPLMVKASSRTHHAAVEFGPMVATASIGLALALPVLYPGAPGADHRAAREVRTSMAARADLAGHSAGWHATRPAGHPRGRARQSGAASAGRASTTLVSTPPLRAAGVAHTSGGPLVTQHDNGKGVVQSVIDCVSGGLVVNPQTIGCPD